MKHDRIIVEKLKYLGIIVPMMLLLLIGCEDYLEIGPPTDQIVGEVVFDDRATVEATFAHIYTQLREEAFPAGNLTGISYLMGMYADDFVYVTTDDFEAQSFSDNSVLPSNALVQNLWDTGYSLVYATNRIMEGVKGSQSLSMEDRDRFIGEALFVRAYVHFNLTNLFGAIPYIKTTDYRENMAVRRMAVPSVYESLEEDLLRAKELLGSATTDTGHFRPDHWTASALLSRTYLYHQEWEKALAEARYLLDNSGLTLEPSVEGVFLGNSTETLWQLDARSQGRNTNEAYHFVVLSSPPNKATLSPSLLESFEAGDRRLVAWVGTFSNEEGTWYFPNKYKLYNVTELTEEYSILFRLPEQFLIAAEAGARLNRLDTALEHLNAVRDRAQLPTLEGLDQEGILDAILQERRSEFFSEQAHRFYDLKRTGKIGEVLSSEKLYWEATDIDLPIPESELLKNPNLLPQNEGY